MKLLSLDIETTGLSRFEDRLLGIGVWSPDESHYFTNLADFVNWNSAGDYGFICHSGSFDINWISYLGLDLGEQYIWDTKSLASLLIHRIKQRKGEKHLLSLQNLGMDLLGLSPWKLDREDMASYSLETVREYCLKDCEVTYKLYEKLRAVLDTKSWDFAVNWVMPATHICMELERQGINVDWEGLAGFRKKLTEQFDLVKAELEKKTEPARRFYQEAEAIKLKGIYDNKLNDRLKKVKNPDKTRIHYTKLFHKAVAAIEPFNFSSPKQLLWLLQNYYALPMFNERTEKLSTDEAMLRNHEKHPVVESLLKYRELDKMLTTCIPAFEDNKDPDGKVRGRFNVGGTRTGRLSSSGPNFQNLPKGEFRAHVVASPGNVLLTADYGQIEVRIIAHLSKDKKLLAAFNRGIDCYGVIACELLGLDCHPKEVKSRFPKHREVAKTAGLSILYGTGAAKLQEVLSKELGMELGLREVQQFIRGYRASLGGVTKYKEELDHFLTAGKLAYNLLGRPFAILDPEKVYMQGLNTMSQGSASDLVIYGAHKLWALLRKNDIFVIPRLLVHDELVFEFKADEAKQIVEEIAVPCLTTELADTLALDVPLTIEYALERQWHKP